MAKIVGFFVCLLIISLDIAAGFCGIEAEIAQNKVKHLKLWIFECRMKPSDEAFKLGLAAAGLLILAHLISNLFGGCSFLCSRDDFQKASSNRQLTTACLLFSWYAISLLYNMNEK
ncbi:Tryptophan 2-C-methyltransferase [Bienertia sinuspersici]